MRCRGLRERSATARCCSACPAAWIPPSRRRCWPRPSASSSPASSWTTAFMRKNEGEQVSEVLARAASWDINFICVDAASASYKQAGRRFRAGAQAQDHRRGVHPRLRGRGQEDRQASISWPRAPSTPTSSSGSAAKRRHQEPPQRRRSAGLRGLQGDRRAAARPLQGRGAPGSAVSWAAGVPGLARQPFPGPGLASASSATSPRRKSPSCRRPTPSPRGESPRPVLSASINQYFAALTNMRSVGVMGDERTYDYAWPCAP